MIWFGHTQKQRWQKKKTTGQSLFLHVFLFRAGAPLFLCCCWRWRSGSQQRLCLGADVHILRFLPSTGNQTCEVLTVSHKEAHLQDHLCSLRVRPVLTGPGQAFPWFISCSGCSSEIRLVLLPGTSAGLGSSHSGDWWGRYLSMRVIYYLNESNSSNPSSRAAAPPPVRRMKAAIHLLDLNSPRFTPNISSEVLMSPFHYRPPPRGKNRPSCFYLCSLSVSIISPNLGKFY